jgi:hypothetical protein
VDDSKFSEIGASAFTNGIVFIRLVERLFHFRFHRLAHEPTPLDSGEMIFNCDCVTIFIKSRGIDLTEVTAPDIVDGTPGSRFGAW